MRPTETLPASTPSAFPVHALPKVLRDAVRAMNQTIQAPTPICAGSVLATASLAAQAHANIELPVVGRRALSLYVLTVAKSGERKSAADGVVTEVVNEIERRLASPEGNLSNPILINDLTIEGIYKILEDGARSIGIFNDEGGQVTHSRQAQDDGKFTILTGLSRLWDGNPQKRVRKGDGVSWMDGKRVACHLMLQPGPAASVLEDPSWNDQGALPRFLVSWPETTMGTRQLRDWTKRDRKAVDTFRDRVRQLLEAPHPVSVADERALAPHALTLTSGADKRWRAFHDEIEGELGDGGHFGHVQPYGAKLAEQAGRIAGVFAVVERGPAQKVTAEQMGRAIELARFYIDEIARLQASAAEARRRQPVDQLAAWLRQWPDDCVSTAEILQRGPAPLRRKNELQPVLDQLVKRGDLQPVDGRIDRDGKKRKEAFKILCAGEDDIAA